jgi:flagellin
MALSILNNIASIAAQNQLNVTSKSLSTALFQLSSGSRINSGADDAAGLAIADGLHANITALTQSARNANDGVGELQVADGSLAQVTTLLNRAVTLATEAATGTVSDPQRIALDDEYTAIKAEIDRVGSKTNYNGGQVFTANSLNVFLSDGGATSNSLIGVTTGTLSSTGLNLGGAAAATGTLTQAAGAAAVPATNILTPGGNFAAATTAHSTLTAAVATAIIAGDTATVGGTVYTFVATAGNLTGAANQVVIGAGNDTAITNLAAAIDNTAGGAGVAFGGVAAANAFATAAVTTPGTSGVITVTANINGVGNGTTTGNSVTLTSSVGLTAGAATLGAGTAGTAGGTVTVGGKTYTFVTALSSLPTANEVVGAVQATQLTHLSEAVNAGANSGTDYSASTTQNANVTAGVATGTTLAFTANVAGAAGNFIQGTTSAGAFTALNFAGGVNTGTAPVAAAGNTVTVGGQTYTFVTALSTTPTANEVLVGSTEANSLANLANAINGGSGSGATYGSPTVANTSVTAAALPTSVVFTSLTKGLIGNSVATGVTGTANTFAANTLTGGTASSTNDLLSIADATSALTGINSAIQTVAGLRGTIGATINRLQSAASVITNQVQNLTGAEDGVRAADIPSTVAALAKYSILEQTGISALAQANQQQQLVLKLLQ